MAIRTGRRGRIACRQSAAMNTEPKSFHRMGKGNPILGEKIRVRMAGSAGIWQILFGYRRERIACRQDLVHGPVTGLARRSARLSPGHGRAMHAGTEILDLVAVAKPALLWHHAGCCLRIVGRAVTAGASVLTKRRVHALRRGSRLLCVTRSALHPGNAFGVGEFLMSV
jgi:hypothetical protein